jgi:type IV pilus assembly protein PilE
MLTIYKMKSRQWMYGKKLKAFNLQEMLVVLVIIGILILIALPSLMPLISKAKSIEAQTQLKHIYNLERTYFFMNSKYNVNFDEIGFEIPKTTIENGNSNYAYEILSATNNAFKASATAITDFDGDGIFNVWEIDQNQNLKEIVKD